MVFAISITTETACTKVVVSGPDTIYTGKTNLKVYDFTTGTAVTTYSTAIVAPDNSSYVFTPGIDTNYYSIPAGNLLVKALAYTTGYLYSPTTVALQNNSYYSSFIYNTNTSIPAIGFVKDDLSLPPTGYSRIRILYFVNTRVTNSPVTLGIYGNSDTLFTYNRTDVDFLRIPPLTNYTNVHAGQYTAYINGINASASLNLLSGRIYTLAISKNAAFDYSYKLHLNK
ncbi:MAG: DUF4397 domain-containing protein [Sphingobacteriia bacterium]|nr:DUF4397 domain-containing protein [Sphingobacteriia bacterium]